MHWLLWGPFYLKKATHTQSHQGKQKEIHLTRTEYVMLIKHRLCADYDDDDVDDVYTMENKTITTAWQNTVYKEKRWFT